MPFLSEPCTAGASTTAVAIRQRHSFSFGLTSAYAFPRWLRDGGPYARTHSSTLLGTFAISNTCSAWPPADWHCGGRSGSGNSYVLPATPLSSEISNTATLISCNLAFGFNLSSCWLVSLEMLSGSSSFRNEGHGLASAKSHSCCFARALQLSVAVSLLREISHPVHIGSFYALWALSEA